MVRTLAFLFAVSFVVGCSPNVRKEAADVNGKAYLADGTPITNVQISFHPLDDTPAGSGKISDKGDFTAKLAPGKYAVYFPQNDKATPAEAAAYEKIPANYRAASKDFTVDVKAGSALEIKLK